MKREKLAKVENNIRGPLWVFPTCLAVGGPLALELQVGAQPLLDSSKYYRAGTDCHRDSRDSAKAGNLGEIQVVWRPSGQGDWNLFFQKFIV